MDIKKKSYTTGVIIARLQVATLHEAHKELIDTVLKEHPKVMIFLGLSPVRGSIRDPLDFQARKQMILESYPHDKYPNLSIYYIKDNRSDRVWSEKLDENIADLLSPNDTVVLYGSRDSFLTQYSGRFDNRELQATRYVSGTELRAKIAQAPQNNPQFRAGAIWATAQRYPLVYSTVDVILFDPKERRILLARKPLEDGYRFIGGFADPKKDKSFEDAAFRELEEETKISVANIEYITSRMVDDWRYANNPAEKIITHLYLAYYSMGCPQPQDDILEVCWVNYDSLNKETIISNGQMATALVDRSTIEAETVLVKEHWLLWNFIKNYIDGKFPLEKESYPKKKGN